MILGFVRLCLAAKVLDDQCSAFKNQSSVFFCFPHSFGASNYGFSSFISSKDFTPNGSVGTEDRLAKIFLEESMRADVVTQGGK